MEKYITIGDSDVQHLVIEEIAYIYIIRRGSLKMLTGFITEQSRNRYCFRLRNDINFTYTVSKEEGKVYNNAVWFRQQNDKKAFVTLYNSYKDKVAAKKRELRLLNKDLKVLEDCLDNM